MVTRPLSQRPTSGPSKGCMVPFALIFLAVGGIGTYLVLVRPMSKLLASRSWAEARCTVLSSRVAESSSSSSPTYAVDIHYTWVAGGSAHESNRYDFMGGSSSGTAGKQKIVDRYPPGARVPCWVDPNDPTEAVLDRGLSPVYLFGLLPLAFVAFGVATLVWALRSGKVAAVAGPVVGASPFGVPPPVGSAGSAELRPASTPLGMLLGLILIALFWNGIVSVFVWQDAAMWRGGEPSIFLTLFLVPFVLIGLVLIFGVGRQLLVLFNPRPHLSLTPGMLAVGESAYLQWRLGSGGRGVQRVKITFEGREEARYQSGKNTQTARETFLAVPVVDATQPIEIATGGSASFAVPAGAMPSFRADHNRIVWSLKVHCDLPLWPDSDDEYEVVVRPGGGG